MQKSQGKSARPLPIGELPYEDLQLEEKDLCLKIDEFFTAMKLLQRAVNKKEDISELKVSFETKQRALQKLSKGIQSRADSGKLQQFGRSSSSKGL